MFGIALRSLRHRRGAFVGTFVAMFFGAVIVFATGALMETGVRARAPLQRLAAADIHVVAGKTLELPGGGDEAETALLPERVRVERELADRIRDLPGVGAAVPDVSVPVSLRGRQVSGHDWATSVLAPSTLADGSAPTPGQVVLGSGYGVRTGDSVDLVARGEEGRYRVSGTVAGDGVYFATADVTRLSGTGGADLIGVVAAPGADVAELSRRVAEVVKGTGAVLLTGNERGVSEFPEVAAAGTMLVILAGVTGGLTVPVAVFVIASTLVLSIQQREREMALLRTIGTTPGQLRAMVLGESTLLAAVASALGCLPGVLLAKWLLSLMAGAGMTPPQLTYQQGVLPVLVAVGVGLLSAAGAALIAAHRAARIRPTQALAEAAIQRRWLTRPRAILASLTFAGGIVLMVATVTVFEGPVAAATAGPTSMVWAIGLALIAPGVTTVCVRLLRRPLGMVSGEPGRLAMINAGAYTVKVAAAATPIMLATGIATANIFLQSTMTDAAQRAYTENLRADAVLTATAGGISPAVAERVRAVPGVSAVSEVVSSSVFVMDPADGSDEGRPVQGVSADGVSQTTGYTVTGGSLSALAGDTVALPSPLARRWGVGVGDTVKLRLGDGSPLAAKVIATVSARPGFETLLMPVRTLAPHTSAGLPTQLLVRSADTGALRDFAAGRHDVVLGDRTAQLRSFHDQAALGAWVNYALVGMIAAYTVIAVVNTQVMATLARRREFGLQRLTGSTRGQVMRMVLVEGALVAIIGVLLGGIAAATTLVPFSLVVKGTPLPSGSPLTFVSIVAAAAALALVSMLVPAWRSTRRPPIEAVATE
ncbi:FtsX-like permease family protein [Nonomuraea sp. NPDC050547]|uniref:FtsX-like permease family protein n=1 Tax=Nonomuraea sp. NPDC050547 TaxID=3364368 RepID=UPI0037B2AA75